MRSISEVRSLLDRLNEVCADKLEDQDLDFKEWNPRSMADAVAIAVEMAICMANGGGGTVVFGVNDRRIGRSEAVLGVPPVINSEHHRSTPTIRHADRHLD
ncbi:MAG TPA: RNA-binding domain-containing protein, partial [Longimicrobiaceae bacterium]|nr:RNA-binding domain-containing protein [Longimicrobiaceae bacterium]